MTSLILVGILFLAVFAYDPKTDYYHPKWWLVVQFILCVLCYKVYLLSSFPIALFFFYISSSANWYSMNIFSKHIAYIPRVNTTLMRQFTKTLLCTIVLMEIFINFRGEWFDSYLTVSPYLLIIGSVHALLPLKWLERNVFNKKITYYTFAGNPSVAPSLLSLIAMGVLFKVQDNPVQLYVSIASLVLCFAAMIRMKGSAGLGAFLAGITAYVGILWPLYGVMMAVSILLSIPLLMKLIPGLFCLSERKEIFKFSFDKIYGLNGKWFGCGVGSYPFLMPSFLLEAKKKGAGTLPSQKIFIWMHSDTAQFILEGGIVGSFLLMILLISIGFSLYGAPAAFVAFAVAYGVNSLINFPNHLAPDSLLAVIMLRFLQGA